MSDRTLTIEDVQAIKEALTCDKTCLFSAEEQKDLKESAKFYKHFNEVMLEGGSVIRKTIIVIGIGGLVTLIGMGLVVKIKGIMGS